MKRRGGGEEANGEGVGCSETEKGVEGIEEESLRSSAVHWVRGGWRHWGSSECNEALGMRG